MRHSGDEIESNRVWNGYDYKLQVWVKNGLIQDCAHPKNMQEAGCCKSRCLVGKNILLVPEAEFVINMIHADGKYIRR